MSRARPQRRQSLHGFAFRVKAQEAIQKIKQAVPEAKIELLQLDLTELAAVRKAAEDFTSREQRLDILLNNAGVMATPYTFTKDGLELQVGTNVVGHYLFTMLLLPTLVSTSKLPEYAKPDSPIGTNRAGLEPGSHHGPSDTSFKDPRRRQQEVLARGQGDLLTVTQE